MALQLLPCHDGPAWDKGRDFLRVQPPEAPSCIPWQHQNQAAAIQLRAHLKAACIMVAAAARRCRRSRSAAKATCRSVGGLAGSAAGPPQHASPLGVHACRPPGAAALPVLRSGPHMLPSAAAACPPAAQFHAGRWHICRCLLPLFSGLLPLLLGGGPADPCLLDRRVGCTGSSTVALQSIKGCRLLLLRNSVLLAVTSSLPCCVLLDAAARCCSGHPPAAAGGGGAAAAGSASVSPAERRLLLACVFHRITRQVCR